MYCNSATLYAAQVFIYSCASILAFLALQHTVQNRPGWLLQEGRLCPTGSLFTTLRTDATVAASTKNGAFVFNFLWRNIFTRLVGPLVVFPLFFSSATTRRRQPPVMLPNLSLAIQHHLAVKGLLLCKGWAISA